MNKMKYSMILSLMFFAFYATARSGNASAAGEVIVLNKADFLAKVFNYEKNASEWKYEGDKPCIIDFYADWCGPCRRVAPILKELAAEYKDDIVIYKVSRSRNWRRLLGSTVFQRCYSSRCRVNRKPVWDCNRKRHWQNISMSFY